MKKLIIISFIFCTINAYGAKDCNYSIDKSSVKLKWTAFKTSKKIGVSGTFKTNDWQVKSANSIEGVLKTLKFKIKTKSMDSGSWIRDSRVYKNFFKLMKNGTEIKGHGISYIEKDKKSVIEVDMNGERTPVVFKTEIKKDNSFVLNGSIDVLKHFKMKKSYESIAKLCDKLHAGPDGISKTWTDVDLQIVGIMSKVCK